MNSNRIISTLMLGLLILGCSQTIGYSGTGAAEPPDIDEESFNALIYTLDEDQFPTLVAVLGAEIDFSWKAAGYILAFMEKNGWTADRVRAFPGFIDAAVRHMNRCYGDAQLSPSGKCNAIRFAKMVRLIEVKDLLAAWTRDPDFQVRRSAQQAYFRLTGEKLPIDSPEGLCARKQLNPGLLQRMAGKEVADIIQAALAAGDHGKPGVVILADNGAKVTQFDSTLSRISSFETEEPLEQIVVVPDSNPLILLGVGAQARDHVVAIRDGQRIWTHTAPRKVDSVVAVPDGVIVGFYRGLQTLDYRGELLRQSKSKGSLDWPRYHDGKLLACEMGRLVLLDAEGQRLCRTPWPGSNPYSKGGPYIWRGAFLDGGVLVTQEALARTPQVAFYDVECGGPAWAHDLSDNCRHRLTSVGRFGLGLTDSGKLFAVDGKGALHCCVEALPWDVDPVFLSGLVRRDAAGGRRNPQRRARTQTEARLGLPGHQGTDRGPGVRRSGHVHPSGPRLGRTPGRPGPRGRSGLRRQLLRAGSLRPDPPNARMGMCHDRSQTDRRDPGGTGAAAHAAGSTQRIGKEA